ncbi:ABC transporter substrate-binding protein [uncultured Parolsenella sp.]|uniref:ABC transporter substrate-binding protein n=1 Tax=uncultured Parolsenella sp. TaxID=2083008 RepID=UPI0025FC6C79|nr:ABC transporter substrate-binding protein [uncultured Parolsenella sp.]
MKSISRRSFVAAGAGAVALGLAACGNSGSSATTATTAADGEKSYQIGVLQLTQHAALDAANEGFVAALDASGISYTIDQQNANNDQSACSTIASKLVGDNDDLIYVIATPAAQAVAAATTEIPIVGCAITDYAASGLVADNEKPGGNLTGTSDMNPVDDQIAMLQKVLPEAKHVGMLYCTAESNSLLQIEMAEAACDKAGLTHERFTVSSSNEVQSVVESMIGKVDAGYSPTDNTIAAAAAQVGQICKEGKLPFVTGEENMCMGMGICTLSIDYTELGKMAGEMAVKILTEGADPADMAIETESGDQLKVVKNEEMAEALGIDLSVLDA